MAKKDKMILNYLWDYVAVSSFEIAFSAQSEGDFERAVLPKTGFASLNLNESILRTAKMEEMLTDGETANTVTQGLFVMYFSYTRSVCDVLCLLSLTVCLLLTYL